MYWMKSESRHPPRSTVKDPNMPATSEARIQANRQNALRSTGPKTEAGKERSRQNGLKHGLTGSGVVVAENEASSTVGSLAVCLQFLRNLT
jgi:hypothetical protein